MGFKRRIFVSSPNDDALSPVQREIISCILKKIEAANYEPQQFFVQGLPENMAWTFGNVTEVMHRCSGAILLGFPRWVIPTEQDTLVLASDFTHFEGAVAHTLKMPVLTIAQEDIPSRGVFWQGGGNVILYVPRNADASWVESNAFNRRFSPWMADLQTRKDIFLGYCSKAKLAAQAIHLYLTKELNLTVLDWAMDFTAGGTILEEIENAATKCAGGIFLFTKDDPLEGDSHQAAPRDNVIFETGYFIHAIGKERVLIIREADAKMPADIGGNIYLTLPNLQNTAAIESAVRKFVENRL